MRRPEPAKISIMNGLPHGLKQKPSRLRDHPSVSLTLSLATGLWPGSSISSAIVAIGDVERVRICELDVSCPVPASVPSRVEFVRADPADPASAPAPSRAGFVRAESAPDPDPADLVSANAGALGRTLAQSTPAPGPDPAPGSCSCASFTTCNASMGGACCSEVWPFCLVHTRLPCRRRRTRRKFPASYTPAGGEEVDGNDDEAKLIDDVGAVGVDVADGDTSKTVFPCSRTAGSGSRRWDSAVASPELQPDNLGHGIVRE